MGSTWKRDPTSWRTTPRPTGWKKTRQRILERDGHRCTWDNAGHRCTERATDVDHIGAPDDHSDDNLRSLCGPHHDHRTAHQAAAASRTARASRPGRLRAPERHPGLLGP